METLPVLLALAPIAAGQSMARNESMLAWGEKFEPADRCGVACRRLRRRLMLRAVALVSKRLRIPDPTATVNPDETDHPIEPQR